MSAGLRVISVNILGIQASLLLRQADASPLVEVIGQTY
jgi:hypothetical protein